MWLLLLLYFIVAAISFTLIRVYQVAHSSTTHRSKAARTMIVLGSGGHTAEMLTLTEHLDPKLYSPRIYVVANNDPISTTKAIAREGRATDYEIVQIPRSRAVRQSYASAVFTTARAFISCVPIVWKHRPDVVLCNGPGTCVPIVLIVYLMRLVWVNAGAKLVFVESYCRVNSISLSGRMLQWLVNLFVVQWPDLQRSSGRMQYLGKLM